MLYFDWYNPTFFGAKRQHLWAILHFPFHLSLALFVAGASQFVVWRKLVEIFTKISTTYLHAETAWLSSPSPSPSTADPSFLLNLTTISAGLLLEFPPLDTHVVLEITSIIAEIRGMLAPNVTRDVKGVEDKTDELAITIANSVFGQYGIEAPADKIRGSESPQATLQTNIDIIALVYIYFSVCAGTTLLIMTTLHAICHRPRTRADFLRLGYSFVVGVVFVVFAAIVNTNAGGNFITSSWVLPCTALLLGSVLVASHLHRSARRKRDKKTRARGEREK